MKKFFTSWILIFIVSLAVICAAFYMYKFNDISSQPSKRWSRGVLIKEIDDSKVNGSTRIRIASVPIVKEKKCLVFWNEKDSLNAIPIDQFGHVGKQVKISVKLGEPVKMKAALLGDKIHFYLLESNVLREYIYDIRTKNFRMQQIIAEHMNDFVYDYENGNLLLVADNEISMLLSNGVKKIVCRPGGQLAALFHEGSDYHIAFTRSDENTQIFVNYCRFDPSGHAVNAYEIGRQFLGNNETGDFDSLLIAATGNTMNIMASRKLQIPTDTCRRVPRSTNNRIMLYRFSNNMTKPVDVKTTLVDEVSTVEPNPVMNYHDNDGFGFISSKIMTKGRKTSSIDLVQYEFRDGKVRLKELMTNTMEISREPFWFKLGNSEYLQWEDRNGSTTKIMIAGTDAGIIHTAGAITSQRLLEAFLESLVPLGFSLSYLLLIFSCIILPTFAFILLASVFFMSWAEQNNRKMTVLSCLIHLLAGIAMILYFDIGHKEVVSIEPVILQNTAGKLLLTVFIAAVSYFCMVRRFNDEGKDRSFINQYLMFAIVDMILFSLMIFPYYYI